MRIDSRVMAGIYEERARGRIEYRPGAEMFSGEQYLLHHR
jgi:hypothetical protein